MIGFGPRQGQVDQQVAVAHHRLLRLPQRSGDAQHVRPLLGAQGLAVADRAGAESLGAIASLDPQPAQRCPVHVGTRVVEKPGPDRVVATVEDPLEGDRNQPPDRAALHHQVHAVQETHQPFARRVLDEVLVERPVEESQRGRVLEGDPGDIGAAKLELHRILAPGLEEGGIRLPEAPGIGRLPAPLAVQGIELRHGDGMTQQRPDGAVAAGEVQHPQGVAAAAGGRHRTMESLQPSCQHRRHPVVGRPQRGEVGARVFEIVDPIEVVLVGREAIGRFAHAGLGSGSDRAVVRSELGSRDDGTGAGRARRCRNGPHRP